jgi:putative mRNA 3-end processing factor
VLHQRRAVSLHPAGHVLGSAQVRIEHRGQVWVASGDYFVSGAGDANATCAAFEPVRCDCFITESTFGLPVYRWRPQAEVMAASTPGGSSQRRGRPCQPAAGLQLRQGAAPAGGRGRRHRPDRRARCGGSRSMPPTAPGVPLPPPGAGRGEGPRRCCAARWSWRRLRCASAWARRLGDFSDAFASGWMQLRGARRRQGVDRGFVLSDHADWPGLQRAIAATGASV